jgi:hypothetical protein
MRILKILTGKTVQNCTVKKNKLALMYAPGLKCYCFFCFTNGIDLVFLKRKNFIIEVGSPVLPKNEQTNSISLT